MKCQKNLIAILILLSQIVFAKDFNQTDVTFSYKFAVPTHTYHKYCKNIYSQNGEDGILAQLIKELSIQNGTFCEFGASDGIVSSNTYNLIKQYNFSGVAIESDTKLYQQCVKNYHSFSNVRVFNGMVLYNDPENNLDTWLEKGGLPKDFDVLSIDIDGDDYFVWEGLHTFSPKIVIFETNSYRDPVFEELPSIPATGYNIDPLKQWCPGRVAVGCSFISAVRLGLQKGYIPVAYTGNITFVRKDLVHKLQEFPYIVSDDPYDYLKLYTHLILWGDQWKTNSGVILNCAIRDYFLQRKSRFIDIAALNERSRQISANQNVIF